MEKAGSLSPLAFVIRVLPPLGIAFAAALVGMGFGGTVMNPDTFFPFLLLELLALLGTVFFQRDARVNGLLLVILALLTGVLLSTVAALGQKTLGGMAIQIAALLAVLIHVGLIYMAYRSPRDLSFLSLPVVIGIGVVIVGWLVGLVIPYSRPVQVVWNALASVVYLALALLVTDRVAHGYTEADGTVAAISLFISGINLFAALLTLAILLL
jgi:FtsH-binding integral membrane protein